MFCLFSEVSEQRISKTCDHCDMILCNNGHYANISVKCIYDMDEYGYIIGCRDVTHLRDCGNIILILLIPKKNFEKMYCCNFNTVLDDRFFFNVIVIS